MPRNSIHTFDEEKTRQLILYLASRVDIGKTKLMKLLYLIDFTAYEKTGKPITNDMYEHWVLGPVPNNIWNRFDALLSGIIKQERENRGSGIYTRLVSIASPDLSIFTRKEREVIDSIIEKYGNLYQRELVEIVHKELPYRITQKDEVIPYFLAPYRNYKRLSRTQLTKLRSNKAYVKRLRDAYRAFKGEQAERAIA